MNARKIMRIYKAAFVILLSVTFWGRESHATAAKVDRRIAEKIAKEKGLLKPTEVLEWKTDPKDIPKDWVKLDNKYFSVSYPKCFSIEGEEGDGDENENPKITPSVLFRRGTDCPGFVKGYGESNSFSIGYFPTAGI